MASTDSRPVPKKNTAYRVVFAILDADGDLVTGATGLDSEVSKDMGTFADCTNEATEIATSSGMYYLDLTSTEMNADSVAVIVKTSSSGAKTTPMVFYPQESGDIAVTVEALNSAVITAASIAADAIGASELAADAVTEIQSGLATAAALNTVDDFLDTEIAAIKAKTDLIPASPAAVGSAMTLDLTQALDLTPVTDSVGDALVAAVAQGFGKWTISGTTLTLYAHDGTTVVRTFTLDSSSAPTSRT